MSEQFNEAMKMAKRIAHETCKTMNMKYGWSMSWRQKGNKIIVSCDGEDVTETEITDLRKEAKS